jgi:hypothetical protein
LLIGVLAAVLTVVAWLVVKVGLSLQIGEGVGSMGFVTSDLELVAVAVAGYCLGFFVHTRRRRRITRRRHQDRSASGT